MANLLDYVKWRGDIDFKTSPFNDADALILCQLSYLNYDEILTGDFKNKLTFAEIWEKFSSDPDFAVRSDTGALISKDSVKLLEQVSRTKRFENIRACYYVNKLDTENEEQFSAMCFFETKSLKYPFVAFRGTDDTIVGWKEDFNMACENVVPAQKDALEYLRQVGQNTTGSIIIGGHSKGGNLAVYSAAFIDAKIKKRISRVYNLDGPGFRKEVLESQEMKEIIPFLHSVYPKLSIVGMLFNHAGNYSVVESNAEGLMQHEPFSWYLAPDGFEKLPGFDPATEYFHRTFNDWLDGLTREKRELFVETLFNVIQSTEAKTNSEIESNWLVSAARILKALYNIDEETKSEILKIVELLFKSATRNIPEIKPLGFLHDKRK